MFKIPRSSKLSVYVAALFILTLSGSSCESGFEPIDFGAAAEDGDDDGNGSGTFTDFGGSSQIARLQIEDGVGSNEFTIQINEGDVELVTGEIVTTDTGFSRFTTEGTQAEIDEPFFGLIFSNDLIVTTPVGTSDEAADLFIRTSDCLDADTSFNFVNDVSEGYLYDTDTEGLFGTVDFDATAAAFTSTAENNLFSRDGNATLTPRTLRNNTCSQGISSITNDDGTGAVETDRYLYNNRVGLLRTDTNNSSAARRLLAVANSDTDFDLSNLTADNFDNIRAIITDFTRAENEDLTVGTRARCAISSEVANQTVCDFFIYDDLNDRTSSSTTPDYILSFDATNRSDVSNIFSATVAVVAENDEDTDTGDLACNVSDDFDQQSLLFLNCTGFVTVPEDNRRGFSIYMRADSFSSSESDDEA